MSRTGASDPPSAALGDASDPATRQNAPQLSPITSRPPVHSVLTEHSREGAPTAWSVSLPPPSRQFSHTPPTPSSERRTGNPLGVQSILNPQSDVTEHDRRRSASHLESPSPIDPQPAPGLPSISRPPSVDSSQEDGSLNRLFHGPGRPAGRHLLSPRSPKTHRTPSLGVTPGKIDAHASPFLSPSTRPYTVETAVSQPTLPTPPAASRPGYFPTIPPPVPTPPPGVVRNDPRRASTGFPQSGSASPMTSYSPYSQPASVASGQFEPYSGAHQTGSHISIASSTASQDLESVSSSVEAEHTLINMSSGGQSNYQIMTYENKQGHKFQIPVDVQAASRVADEKRKRNAGASARFRQRRKEKEQQASATIQNLQQQLREANEEIEYYRTERDYFRSIVFQQPGPDRVLTRPASPRLRRMSSHVLPTTATSAVGPTPSFAGFVKPPETRESDRNVRRRTSYHPVPGPTSPGFVSGAESQHQPSSAGFPSMNPTPPPISRPPPPPQQHEPLHHVNQEDPRIQRPLPELHQPQQQQPSVRDPFVSSGSGRYGHRNWSQSSAPGV